MTPRSQTKQKMHASGNPSKNIVVIAPFTALPVRSRALSGPLRYVDRASNRKATAISLSTGEVNVMTSRSSVNRWPIWSLRKNIPAAIRIANTAVTRPIIHVNLLPRVTLFAPILLPVSALADSAWPYGTPMRKPLSVVRIVHVAYSDTPMPPEIRIRI